MTWVGQEAPGATAFDRVFGLLPDTYRYYRDLYARAWQNGVDPVILECCRLRVAQLLDCEAELRVRTVAASRAGLTEAKIAALARYYESPLYSPVERACLNYAEKFVIDGRSITDDDASQVKAAIGAEGLPVLGIALALFDGFSRFRVALGIGPDRESITEVELPEVVDL